MGIAHKIYSLLGGKKGSFLQQKWSNYCKKKECKRLQKLLQEYGMEALQAFKDACTECSKDYWLEFGTLLGAVREKSFIRHDFDLDVGMPADAYTDEFEKVLLSKGFVKDHFFYLVNVKSNEKTPSEHAFFYKGIPFDIFLRFHQGDAFKTYSFNVGEGCAISVTKEYTFSVKEPLSKVFINGLELNAPADPTENLSTYYGENFMTPDPNCTENKRKNTHIKRYTPDEFTGILIRCSKNVQ